MGNDLNQPKFDSFDYIKPKIIITTTPKGNNVFYEIFTNGIQSNGESTAFRVLWDEASPITEPYLKDYNMCKCLERIKTETRSKIKTEIEAATTIFEWEDEGDFKDKVTINGKDSVALPFVYAYTRRKINSEPEKKITNGYVNVIPNFCPFCGQKLKA